MNRRVLLSILLTVMLASVLSLMVTTNAWTIASTDSNPDQLKLVGLDKAPSHTAIRNALSRIPESYLKRLNDRLVEPFKKGVLE